MRHYKKLAIGAALTPLLAVYNFDQIFRNPATEVGDAIAQASELVMSNVTNASTTRDGRHLGFDTYAYPGDDAMLAWRDDSVPFEWVGYYLPSPCHRSDSWSGKRERLTQMGWGLAVIYVGQQTWADTPPRKIVKTKYVTKRVKVVSRHNGRRVTRYVRKKVPIKVVTYARAQKGSNCSGQFVTAARGALDASDAITRTASEGFARGSVIFLDIERMDSVPKSMRDYYKAWTAGVLADGRFRPGYYVHDHNAALVYRDVSSVFVNAAVTSPPQFWIAGSSGFSEDAEPHEVGHSFANVWQGMLDVVQTHNGVKLPIDVNVASVPSPSSHEYALSD
jgi:hypothetical protein